MYAKVFAQIFDSSIAEDYQVRLVFEDLLKLSNMEGIVDMTHEAISRRTNVPLEIVIRAIFILESPDPKSRTQEKEGRRIVRLDDHRDWGWWIVNYEKFRGIRDEEARRQYQKEWIAHKRKQGSVDTCRHLSTQAEAEAEAEAEKKEVPRGAIAPVPSAQDLASLWNGMAEKSGIGRVKNLSDPRKRHIKARMSDPYFVANFEEAIMKIGASNFCRGLVGKGWRADFDWLIEQPNVITKIMEGKYDNQEAMSTDARGSKDQLSIAERDLMRMARQCDSRKGA